MEYCPILINLKDKECLVVGAGKVGMRKIKFLLKFSPQKITVIDPKIDPKNEKELNGLKKVEIKKRKFKQEDLNGKFLVIASTDDPTINSQIAALCKEKKILCNIVDRPELSSFIVPATILKGDLIITISTSGASPALAKKIKGQIATTISDDFIKWISVLKKIRPHVIALGLTPQENKLIFENLINDTILNLIEKKDINSLKEKLKKMLPSKLEKKINRLIDECIN